MSVDEEANITAQQVDHNISEDVNNSVKRHIIPLTQKRRRSQLVFDASKETIKTHSNQRISTRKRKRAKPRSAFLSMIDTAKHIHNVERRVKTSKIIQQFVNLACLSNGEFNDIHPLTFAAGGLGPNPNILNHRNVFMKIYII